MATPRSLLVPAAACVALAGCSTARPSYVEKHHGLGGFSLVYVDALDTSKTQHVGRLAAATPGELGARFRLRLLQELRSLGMQTRDGTGEIPDDGVLVRGRIHTVDGGTTDGVKVGGQRVHCTIELWNGDESESDPAFELKITGTPGVTSVVTESGAILAAADDAADQVAKFIRENP